MIRIISGCLLAIGISEVIKLELRYREAMQAEKRFWEGMKFATQTAPE